MKLLILVLAMPLVITQASPDCEGLTPIADRPSVAALERRLIEPIWPDPPPGARIEGYAIFEVTVSRHGSVGCVGRGGGHPFLMSVLEPAIRSWKFRPGRSFVGLVPIRYTAAGYRLL